MAVWLVRAGKHGERQEFALQNGEAVIGWSELPDLSKTKSREEMKGHLQRAFTEIPEGRLNNFAGQLWAFVSKIQLGDLVVLPLKKGRGTIAIGEVTGPYKYQPDNPISAQHTRKVKWLRDDLPRGRFDQDLLYSLGATMTVCRIQRNNAEARIRAILKGQRPPALDPEEEDEDEGVEAMAPVDVEAQAKEQISTHITQKFAGHKLAQLVRAILEAQGFECLLSEPGPDGGVDILAGQGKMGFDEPRLCVQVKSGSSPVDVKVLRELKGVMRDFSAAHGLLVSWSGFKSSVIEEARRTYFEIRLWSAEDVLDMIQQHYEKFGDELKADLPLKRVWTIVLED